MWLEYLKECLFEEIDIVFNLIGIDQQVQGEKNDINDIISFINDNVENLNFYNITIESVLTDGHPVSLIKVLSDLVEKNNKVVVMKNNLAINNWIIEKYKEFLSDNGSEYKLDLNITDVFEMESSAIIIGSLEFVNEMRDCIDLVVREVVEEY